jgi:tetratricopeptide (TPR) repeat protein
MELLSGGRRPEALERARTWQRRAPEDLVALVALGEALEASGDRARAARAYGSIIELHPSRAELRRFAGARLERLGQVPARALAIDSYRKAALDRPDHPGSHRLLALALLRAGRPAEAFEVLAAAIQRRYPDGRFAGVDRILREDLGLVAAAWIRAEPGRERELRERLWRSGGLPEDGPSLRFVLHWETDANDVDLHVRDGRGQRAYYGTPALPAGGGTLYADVANGFGPECFTVRLSSAERAYPYRLSAHYYSRGPMGHGLGTLQVIEHDGRGTLRFEDRPFLVMRDRATVELGAVTARSALALEQHEPQDPRHRQRVGDLPGAHHAVGLLERHHAQGQLLGVLGLGAPGGDPAGHVDDPPLVAHRVGQVHLDERLQALRLEAGLLAQLAARPLHRVLAVRRAALGDLPRVGSEGHPVLAHQPDLPVLERDNAHRLVLELHHPVDARLPARAQHLVLDHGDPGVLVHLPRRQHREGVAGLVALAHDLTPAASR